MHGLFTPAQHSDKSTWGREQLLARKAFEVCVKMQGLKDALVKDQNGQDLIEYALVVALIALAATAGIGNGRQQHQQRFQHRRQQAEHLHQLTPVRE